ncbi:MAG: hypothetical protein MSA68_00895 [Helicobacter sp.]|nr:hypothetical protein [Helicobacter sp.]
MERIVQNLTIKEGAIVEGANGSGLVLGNVEDKKNGSTNGKNNRQEDTYQLTGKIQVDGTLKGKTAGITNYKDMGTEGGI